MNPTLAMVALVGACQGLILAAAIGWLPYGKPQSNRLLAAYLLNQAVFLAVIRLAYVPLVPPYQIYALVSLGYLAGPLLLLYVCSLVSANFRLRLFFTWHLLPFVLAFTVQLSGWLITLQELQALPYDRQPLVMKQRIALVMLPMWGSWLVYGLWAWLVLRRHGRQVQDSFSATEQVSLRWLRTLSALAVGIALFVVVAELAQLLSGRFVLPLDGLAVVLSAVMIAVVGVFGIRQPQIFGLQPTPSDSPLAAEPLAEPKYEKSGLDGATLDRYWHKLQQHMESQRPHLVPGIKLADLARALGMLPNYLSQVVNTRAQCNFYDFINGYRVNSARALLADPQWRDKPLVQVAEAAGFSSQNAFNSHFKKRTGTTPSKFRKSALSQETV